MDERPCDEEAYLILVQWNEANERLLLKASFCVEKIRLSFLVTIYF